MSRSGADGQECERSRAYELFREGKDTLSISRHLDITEPQALAEITWARTKRLGLADPCPQLTGRP